MERLQRFGMSLLLLLLCVATIKALVQQQLFPRQARGGSSWLTPLRVSTPKKDPVSRNEASADLARIRQHRVFNFSTSDYPFQEAALQILEKEGGESISVALDMLHLSKKGDCAVSDKSGAELNYYQSLWNRERHLDDVSRGAEFAEFGRIYKRFVAEVCGPALGGGRVLYQRTPTLRVYTPGKQTAMGKFHCDEEFLHQPSEINFWLPLTGRVFGSNSLWVESEPMKGDFAPLNLSYGQCYSGWLNQCRHGCVPNDSSRTRVSIDFRIVTEATGGHNPDFKRGLRRGPKAKFQTAFDVGGFYDLVTLL